MWFRKILAAITSMLLGASLAGANTWYVSTSGRDWFPCTQSEPCATIQHASTLALPGDTVLVAAGTYKGSIHTSASGTSAAYITYKATTADFSNPVMCAQVAANHGALSDC